MTTPGSPTRPRSASTPSAGIAGGQDRRRSRRRPWLGRHLAAHRRIRPARRPRHLHRRPRPPDGTVGAAAVARDHDLRRPGGRGRRPRTPPGPAGRAGEGARQQRRSERSSTCSRCPSAATTRTSPTRTAIRPALTATSFATILRDLGKVGIIVVAGAGNDATTRPFLPAAFAGDTDHRQRRPAAGQRRLAQPEPEQGLAVLQQRHLGHHLPPRGCDHLDAAAQAERQQPGLRRRGRHRHPAGGRQESVATRARCRVRRTGRPSTSTTTPAASASGAARRSPPRPRRAAGPRARRARQRGHGPRLAAEARLGGPRPRPAPEAADDEPPSLGAQAATAFVAYREGDRGQLRTLVSLLTPLLWHTARSQNAPEGGGRGRDPDRLAAPGGRRGHHHRPEGRRLLAGDHRQAGELAAAPARRP